MAERFGFVAHDAREHEDATPPTNSAGRTGSRADGRRGARAAPGKAATEAEHGGDVSAKKIQSPKTTESTSSP